MTVHIRKDIGYRRDRRIGARNRTTVAETFCGAPVTAYDITPRDYTQRTLQFLTEQGRALCRGCQQAQAEHHICVACGAEGYGNTCQSCGCSHPNHGASQMTRRGIDLHLPVESGQHHTIKLVRAQLGTSKVSDYHVLINGEHRATFKNGMRYGNRTWDLRDPNGQDIHTRRGPDVYRATIGEFADIILMNLPEIPTRAQIERDALWAEAVKEDRQRTQAKQDHRRKVHLEMMEAALTQYIDNADGDFPEHIEAAEHYLAQIKENNRD